MPCPNVTYLWVGRSVLPGDGGVGGFCGEISLKTPFLCRNSLTEGHGVGQCVAQWVTVD